jgi:diketogulonate reductase-like aldo/keto reductase
MTLIDTAEMYGDGRAEELVGEAIAGRRDDIFLVSKVLPSHATEAGTIAACRESLRRIGTDRLDLYLLHWRGPSAASADRRRLRAAARGGTDPPLEDGVRAIPEAGTVAHVRQNRASLDLRLDESDMLRLDEAFPPPLTPQPLEIL